ncbi:MAG: hypothetical protein UY48_C0013G0011 [Candidatus Gottesmanbacteria bacterium GW2011_GWB1_49_7]|uniref:Uncharacterized protein n=1 Tax=Candidatus Gottesmanbacteria bacterium GW2011_GWB1_49_7 TaxID=1618448 RepID=A0A0G1VZI0_9BACT|nr:MAG: hypothetical protein UY48_C0013G0011 [Candidatus Gottesmanbacteria bacterium GW2011_GWB1_49_7]
MRVDESKKPSFCKSKKHAKLCKAIGRTFKTKSFAITEVSGGENCDKLAQLFQAKGEETFILRDSERNKWNVVHSSKGR